MVSQLSPRMWLLIWIAAFILIAAACTGSFEAQGSGEVGIADQASTQSSASSVTLENPVSYDPAVAQYEAYWYSRYNLGHLVMRSGMGIQWMPPVSNQQKWDTLGAERSGAGWRSGELPEGPVVASSPFGGLSLHLLPAL